MAGRVGSTLWLSAVATVVMLGLAAALYNVEIRAAAVPALALVILVGTISLAALGLALAALVPQASSVDAIALGTLLPVALLSNVFPIAAEFPAVVSTVMGGCHSSRSARRSVTPSRRWLAARRVVVDGRAGGLDRRRRARSDPPASGRPPGPRTDASTGRRLTRSTDGRTALAG